MSKKRKIFLAALWLALLSVLAYATVSTTQYWKIVRENTLFVNDVGITGPLFIDGAMTITGAVSSTGDVHSSGTITATTGFSGALNGTVGASTPAAGTFTTVKVDENGSTISQINCGTTTIDAGTTGTTVSLTGCTAETRIFVTPIGYTGSAATFKATPGSGSFIVKCNADPSSVSVVVNWFAIK